MSDVNELGVSVCEQKPISKTASSLSSADSLLAVLSWGLTHSIQQLRHVTIPAVLLPDDFTAHVKIHIHSHHLLRSDDLPGEFKFKEYCPIVFHKLRSNFGISDEDYLKSLTSQCLTGMDSPGRSGSRFLMSHDRRFIVKTLPYDELTQLLHILRDYHQYVVEQQMETLLPQFLGAYRLTTNGSETYLVIMRSVFSPLYDVHRKYDLKGSTVDRSASNQEKCKKLPTFKDNDVINDGFSLFLHDDQRAHLMKLLHSDSQFLSRLGLMDYSLLIGVHNCDSDVASEESDKCTDSTDSCLTTELSEQSRDVFILKSSDQSPCQQIYFLAVIDILTHFGLKKRTAQAAKTVKHGVGAEISTIKPDQYARRFTSFMERIIKR